MEKGSDLLVAAISTHTAAVCDHIYRRSERNVFFIKSMVSRMLRCITRECVNFPQLRLRRHGLSGLLKGLQQ